MLPDDLERVQKYNRVSHEDYVSWLLAKVDMPLRPTYLAIRSREGVDLEILTQMALQDQPPWVDAAIEALEAEEEVEDVEEVEEVEDVEEVEEAEEVIPDQPPDNNNPFAEIDYDSWTVAELREECKSRGITVRGTKAEVVLRLRRDDEGLIQDPVEPDEDETEAPEEDIPTSPGDTVTDETQPDVPEEAAEESSDAPSEEEAATEEVTQDADSGETSNTEEEE